MTLIVDASVAIKWVLSEADSDRADRLFDEDDLAAPRLWRTETANVLWKYWRRGVLTSDEMSERLRSFGDMPVETMDDESLLEAAASFAAGLNHPVYDCLYLAAAVARNSVCVTADRAFVTVVKNSSFAAFVRLL